MQKPSSTLYFDKSVFYILLTVAIAGVSGIGAFYFIQSETFQTYLIWAQSNLFIFVSLILIAKFLSVIYPPLPSVILTLSAIPIIGWFPAYLIDYAGSILGSSISYWIAHKYGVDLLKKILAHETVDRINNLRVKKGREIEGVIVLRFLMGTTLVEAVNYGAGLLKVPYSKFLIGILISHPLFGAPTFYFVNNILEKTNLVTTFILIVTSLIALYLLRNRYFESVSEEL